MKRYIPKQIKELLRKGFYFFMRRSMQSAVKEQALIPLIRTLKDIVPNIVEQYTSFAINSPYLQEKVRSLHAFQISLVQKVIHEFSSPTIVDIGDSSGTHIQYLEGLYRDKKSMQCMSV